MPVSYFGLPMSGPTKDDLANQLRDLLADTVQYRFLAHGSHWNVQGVNFQQFHELFGEIYADLEGSIDPLAENIRKLNFTAPIQLSDYLESSEEVGEQAPTLSVDPVQLAMTLYKANEDTLECVVKAIMLATQINEQGIVNFLADRQDMLSKWQWQLRSVVGDQFADGVQENVAEVSLETE